MSRHTEDVILSGHRISDWARSLKLYVSGLCFPWKADPVLSRAPPSSREESVVSILHEDAEVVVECLGIRAGEDHMDSEEEEEGAASAEEMSEAFGVFDTDGDGYIGAGELQRVLGALGYKEGRELRNCERMIRAYDENCDGRIDFKEFVRVCRDY